MQTPYRKKETYIRPKADPNITPEKFAALGVKLKRMKEIDRPRLSEETKRLAAMGDFSENAGYQLAKSRLRGLNQRILDSEDLLKRAEIIAPNPDKNSIGLGHSVTVEVNGRIKTYQILGSTETNPMSGVISYSSPLGAALLGHKVGDIVSVALSDRVARYKIIAID
ncbi:MAG: GreA/GreB family elongation factor [Candidatus Falkowbacteria bacterium]|nr:GreA/GreB family elongation factor [Candidatus Falkowbacteria bacterium]